MFLSLELVTSAYKNLKKIDPSNGKSRKEKTSGIRYLIATSRVMRENNLTSIDLSVGSQMRPAFISAVGEVIAFDNKGLYSKDFSSEFDTKADFGVGSNFLTTRLANSRSQDINYPGRPHPLLSLIQEKVAILPEVGKTLVTYYGITEIKLELAIWLLRDLDLGKVEERISENGFHALILDELGKRYSTELVDAIKPTIESVKTFMSSATGGLFSDTKPDYSSITTVEKPSSGFSTAIGPRVLSDDLQDDDEIFKIVESLLNRGSKGILFSGPPGTSKTWYATKVAMKIINGDQEKLERIQFHPSFTYEDFIEGLVSTGSPSGNDPMFKPKEKVFLNLCNKAREDSDNLFILVIDEFNRGDPSKIFGELLTYIEPDYREIVFKLPYSEKETSIPHNVIVFATMNPYDKSVVDLDSAMERRFEFIEMSPQEAMVKSFLKESKLDPSVQARVVAFFNTANAFSPHGFGHTYFKGIIEEQDLILLWNHKLKFIFEKMFRFKPDSFIAVRETFTNSISENNKNSIA